MIGQQHHSGHYGASSDLVEWLRAQLDEDERWAQGASETPAGEHWHWVCTNCDTPLPITDVTVLDEFLECPNCNERGEVAYQVGLRSVEQYQTASMGSLSVGPLPHFVIYGTEEQSPVAAGYIARHDPARTLREVEAKRRLLDLFTPPVSEWKSETRRVFADGVMRLLALPYADRSGYREEWRP